MPVSLQQYDKMLNRFVCFQLANMYNSPTHLTFLL